MLTRLQNAGHAAQPMTPARERMRPGAIDALAGSAKLFRAKFQSLVANALQEVALLSHPGRYLFVQERLDDRPASGRKRYIR